MDLLQAITMEDLWGDQVDLAELIGLENYRKLVKNYGGNSIRILQEATLIKEKRDDEIRSSFTGDNFIELSKKYRLSDRTIRSIVSKETRRRKGKKKNGISVSKV